MNIDHLVEQIDQLPKNTYQLTSWYERHELSVSDLKELVRQRQSLLLAVKLLHSGRVSEAVQMANELVEQCES